MTKSPYLEDRKWSRIKIQRNQICFMLPVVTCLDVASLDATRTKYCDIQKQWESLKTISQNVLPGISASEVLIPRVSAWSYRISAGIISSRKQLSEKTKMNWNSVLRILSKPFKFQEHVARCGCSHMQCAFCMNTSLCLIWPPKIQQLPEPRA